MEEQNHDLAILQEAEAIIKKFKRDRTKYRFCLRCCLFCEFSECTLDQMHDTYRCKVTGKRIKHLFLPKFHCLYYKYEEDRSTI